MFFNSTPQTKRGEIRPARRIIPLGDLFISWVISLQLGYPMYSCMLYIYYIIYKYIWLTSHVYLIIFGLKVIRTYPVTAAASPRCFLLPGSLSRLGHERRQASGDYADLVGGGRWVMDGLKNMRKRWSLVITHS